MKKKSWFRLAVKKKLPLILRRITSKDNSDFYFLNCLHSFATTKNFESHETIYK